MLVGSFPASIQIFKAKYKLGTGEESEVEGTNLLESNPKMK